MEEQRIKLRIAKLKTSKYDNSNIIRKLERRLRKISNN